nr:MAG TPA: Metallo-beta-lactamase superfamily [Caudoviricetes sp.]DAX17430.1 MAG TPA: Metallo-beta-lactamase superfamily [Bacteriophage sp.]
MWSHPDHWFGLTFENNLKAPESYEFTFLSGAF